MQLVGMQVVSMVVPLQTLPGWPSAPNPPVLEVLGLLFGLPIAVMILFSLIGKAGSLREAADSDAPVEVDEPLWLGGPEGAAAIAPGQRAALPASSSSASAAGVETPQSQEVGGASARW